jgi:hypothetical protein
MQLAIRVKFSVVSTIINWKIVIIYFLNAILAIEFGISACYVTELKGRPTVI